MKSSEFREVLAGRISPEEREMLRTSDPELYISDFNRSVCLRVIEPAAGRESTGDPDVDLSSAEELEESLRSFLDEYMSDHPEAHKWIILSCLELTFVEKQPMHPQKSAKWVSRDGHYYCPSMNKDSIICRYCACEEEPDEAERAHLRPVPGRVLHGDRESRPGMGCREETDGVGDRFCGR